MYPPAGDDDAHHRRHHRLLRLRRKLAEAEEILIDNGKQAARVTDEYVHDNPWSAVGIAAGIGFMIGLLIGRR